MFYSWHTYVFLRLDLLRFKGKLLVVEVTVEGSGEAGSGCSEKVIVSGVKSSTSHKVRGKLMKDL